MKSLFHPLCRFLFNPLLWMFISSAVLAQAAPPVFTAVTNNSNSIPKYSKFELNPELIASYTNPYDYDEIVIQGTFTSPTGRVITVDGFYMQEYQIPANGWPQAQGNGEFKVRFTPDEVGTWQYQLSCQTSEGTTQTSLQSFTCTASSAKGFVRAQAGSNYLYHDDGTQFIPIGMNLCWPDDTSNIVTNYTDHLQNLAANDANFIRIWMAAWSFGIEWSPMWWKPFGGLKDYEQSSAFLLDWLLEECRQKDIRIMICDNYHDQVMSERVWADNPYNQANGGMCAKGADFFTNTAAKAIYKNRLRYMVARYGYSPQIGAWELFNEVDQLWLNSSEVTNNQYNPSQVSQDVSDWHTEMLTYLKATDPNQHLVTTSTGMAALDIDLLKNSNFDFVQMHTYLPEANPEEVVALFDQDYLVDYGLPVLNSEYGLSIWESEPSMDPTGIHFHNGMWATLFAGAAGPALEWNWGYIADKDLYFNYAALAAVASEIDFYGDNYRPTESTTSTTVRSDITIIPAYNQWGAPPADTFQVSANGQLHPIEENLGSPLFGMAQFHAPITFNVHYPDDGGTFTVYTGSNISPAGGTLQIEIDGVVRGGSYGATVQTDHAYTVTGISKNQPGEFHTITITNDGSDWIRISRYVFGGAGNPLAAYVLKSADNTKAAGWLHNKPYDWMQTSNPPTISDGQVNVIGMTDGSYNVTYYDCITGAPTTTTSTASQGILSLSPPAIAWDQAFTAEALNTSSTYGSTSIHPSYYGSWGGAGSEHTFSIDSSGALSPSEDTMHYVLYGMAQHHATLQFSVNFLAAGEFRITTRSQKSVAPNIVVTVDGQEVFRQNDAEVSTTYIVPIPAGSHLITLNNDGGDWIMLDSLVFTNTATSASFGATSIDPSHTTWGGGGSEHTFSIDSSGTLFPSEDTMHYLLYGTAQYNAPLQFSANFLAAGEFKITTGGIRSTLPNIVVTVDGLEVFRQNDAAISTTYSVPIAAGSHVITLNNDGSDWIMLDSLEFTNTKTSASFGTTTIDPSHTTWGGGGSEHTFSIDSSGALFPSEDTMHYLLYGTAQYNAPLQFTANFLAAGEFKITTGGIRSTSPNIVVTVDGQEVFRQNDAAISTTYSVPISTGSHVITLNNDGSDWIMLDSLEFTNTTSSN